MPGLVTGPDFRGPDPESSLVDGLIVNGHDILLEKRAAHRARLEAERPPAMPKKQPWRAPHVSA